MTSDDADTLDDLLEVTPVEPVVWKTTPDGTFLVVIFVATAQAQHVSMEAGMELAQLLAEASRLVLEKLPSKGQS